MKKSKKAKRDSGETVAEQKVLLYDVESSPNIAYIWAKYEQNALGDFIKERQIISVAWKWLGKKRVHILSLPMLKGYKKNPSNNRELIKRLHELFCEADITIGHNVDAFDDKMVNTEFVSYGFKPPPPHKTVDTLKVARRYFSFNSNKLGDLGKRLNLGRKVAHSGFELWVGCMRGDKASWKTMENYNKNDVVLLEKIYLKLRPWVQNHPDMNLKDGHVGCSVCRSPNLMPRGWSVCKGATRKRRFQCGDCGKWMTGKASKHGVWKFK